MQIKKKKDMNKKTQSKKSLNMFVISVEDQYETCLLINSVNVKP